MTGQGPGRYRFTRFWARGLVVLGVMCVVTGPVLGLAVAFIPFLATRLSPAAWGLQETIVVLLAVPVGLVAGLLVGGPLIVGGQFVLVFLDQRSLLAKIYKKLRHHSVDEVQDERTHHVAERYLER